MERRQRKEYEISLRKDTAGREDLIVKRQNGRDWTSWNNAIGPTNMCITLESGGGGKEAKYKFSGS